MKIDMPLKSFSRLSAAIAMVMLFSSLSLLAQEKEVYKSVADALRSGRMLAGKSGPQSLNWINGGDEYSYIAVNNETKKNEIRTFDPATGKDELVFDGEGVTFPDTSMPFNYSSFQWARDSKHILFQTHFRRIYRRSGISDYYIYSLDTKSLRVAAKDARTAELSPSGERVGIEREGNMFVYDFDSKKETQLTNDATGDTGIFNGHYDWVYEEEFGQPQAWNWSPDSKYIAFWQFNERKVPIFRMTNFESNHPEYVKIPIPQPGDPNPAVRIGVVDVESGKTVWLDPGLGDDFYIPRIYWTSDPDVLAMLTLNREQNDLTLFFFNVRTGERTKIMEEKNDTWVAIFNFYTAVDDMMYFPEGTKEFFWVSDRSGFYQIYRYAYSGKLINRVTEGDWDVIKVVGIDPKNKTIYYTSAEASPLEEELYSIRFDGSHETRLTDVSGYHQINMSPNTSYYLNTYSNFSTPRQVELCSSDGKTIKTLEDNKDVSQYIQTHAYSPKVLSSFVTSDGVRLDYSIVKPMDFDSTKKYPVVMGIYGGPESQSVYNSFEGSSWTEFLAQHGYIVVDVNNRGNASYGSKFLKVVYKQLGIYESHDFVEMAKYLKTLPYVNGDEMAIMGTSYGGYSTTFTMLSHPGVFKVGIANSPVTDWHLYDDIYTERYMSLPDENKDGYTKTSDMTYADSLRGHLLIVHSMSDDNVHPVNTMQLLTALTNAGKDVDLRIFPPGAHGAAYNFQSFILEFQVYYQYLERYLKGSNDLPNLNAEANK
ncbi:MAG TPA: S9 family peptidase [Candidatus Kryptonia bacterium]